MGAPELELLTHVNLSRVSVSFGATAAVHARKLEENSISSWRLKLEFVCVSVSFFFPKRIERSLSFASVKSWPILNYEHESAD